MKDFAFVWLFTIILFTSNLFAQDQQPVISSGVVNGKAVSLVKPEYPAAAKAVGAGGAVSVQVTIDEQGNVAMAKAVSGHPLLRKSSEDAALASKFVPTIMNGQVVRISGVVVYNFVTDKKIASSTGERETGGGAVLNGLANTLPKPRYPAAAKAVKATGTVIVQVLVNEAGNVISAKAVSGHALLRKSSEKAALKAKFSPTLKNGKAVKTKGVLVYRFLGD